MGLNARALIVAADWIFPITAPPIAGGGLLLEGSRLCDLGPLDVVRARSADAPVLTLPPGGVMPGLINAHTHLELTPLDRLGADDGFAAWAARLIAAKGSLDAGEVEAGVRRGAAALKASGTVGLADVTNGFPVAPILEDEGLDGVVFHELIGQDAGLIESFLRGRDSDLSEKRVGLPGTNSGGRGSISVLPSVHTPFSCSATLIAATARLASERGTPWTMHLAESADEVALLRDGTGPLVPFLRDRGLRDDEIPRPGRHPVAWLESLGCLDGRLIAVHLVQAGDGELDLLKRRNVRPCLCPSSNLHLTGSLPPAAALLAAGLRPALGTDSTASGESLNLFREMEILLESGVDAATILKMATLFGAEALHLGADFGRIEKGNRPALIHLAFDSPAGSEPSGAAIRAGSGRARPGAGSAITPLPQFIDRRI